MEPNEHSIEAPDTVQRLLHASRVGDATTARLATWLLEERKQVVDLPISRFAQETGVTETTIVRFCKGIGYLYQRLLRLGVRAGVCSDPHILTVITTNLERPAVLFGITYSGQSRDLVDALKAAKARKATTIVLTSNGGATAARLADILLISAVHPEMAARETVATRISQLAIVDVLCTALALKRRKDNAGELDPFEKEITRVRTKEG